ncbi:hypothetical protein COV13_04275 [Candidatus Woesearchaeota archaeon CG10_big_fil_rev_8_21_14_0_10_32_9]|nr:MAG: hypothetical protein COV13_04275 [Candidatus Woesearchaeota archaeon CG10_big_fil_rev_8_21_14_0_10_32_9]
MFKSFRNKNYEKLIFLAIFIFYVLWILIKRSPIFSDEFYFYSQLIYIFREGVILPYTYDLTRMLLATIISFPVWLISQSNMVLLVVLRIISAAAMTATLFFGFNYLKKTFGKIEAYTFLVISFFSRLNLYYATTAFSESFFNVFVLLTIIFFLKLYDSPTKKNMLLTALFFGLGFLTRPTMLYFAPILALIYFYKHRFYVPKKTLVSLIIIALVVIIISINTFLPFYAVDRFSDKPALSWDDAQQRTSLSFWMFFNLVNYSFLFPIIIITLFVPISKLSKEKKKHIGILMLIFVAYFFINIYTSPEPGWTRRYYPLLLFLMLSFSILLAEIYKRKRVFAIIGMSMILLFIIVNVSSFQKIPHVYNFIEGGYVDIPVILVQGNEQLKDDCIPLISEYSLYTNNTLVSTKDLPVFAAAQNFDYACTDIKDLNNTYNYLFLNHVSTGSGNSINLTIDGKQASCTINSYENSLCYISGLRGTMCININKYSETLPGIVEVSACTFDYKKDTMSRLQDYFVS